jgi:hypothetical protein
VLSPHLKHFLLKSRKRHYFRQLSSVFPTVPKNILQHLFPLYTPHSIDVSLFWHIPNTDRQGIIVSYDLQVGAGHGILQEVLEKAGQSKAKSIYAETKREHELLLQHFAECEWNRETDPVVLHAKAEKILVNHEFIQGCVTSSILTLPGFPIDTSILVLSLYLSSSRSITIHPRILYDTFSSYLVHSPYPILGKISHIYFTPNLY